MKICPKFALVAAEGELADPGFRFGTSQNILTRQQYRRSLLARAEQHQSREIDQLRQDQCTPQPQDVGERPVRRDCTARPASVGRACPDG